MANQSRYAVTLNIGLRNNPWARFNQLQFVQMFARNFSPLFDTLENSIIEAAYFDNYASAGEHRANAIDSGKVTEATAVVRFDVTGFDAQAFKNAIKTLCAYFTQGAIAWQAHPTNGPRWADISGLDGPRAHEWGGAFDERYFEDGSCLIEHSDRWSVAIYQEETEQ